MTSLKEAIGCLKKAERDLLNYAFENGTAEYITLKREKDYFVGVNLLGNPNLDILETKGLWSYGTLN